MGSEIEKAEFSSEGLREIADRLMAPLLEEAEKLMENNRVTNEEEGEHNDD